MLDFKNISEKPYLLDPNVQSDDPLSIYKSFWQILSENFLLITVLLLIFLAIGFFLYFYRKAKIHEKDQLSATVIDPYDEAVQAIEELQAKKMSMGAKPFVFRLSEILRVYIQKRFKMPAMELTGEEFIVEIASNPFFSGNYEDLLRDFVNQGDHVKYSKETSETSQINLLLDSASFFVKDTHSRLKAQESEMKTRESEMTTSNDK